MRPDVDDCAWPLVRITYGERISLDEIDELAKRLRQLFEQRGPMITVSDLSRVTALEATAMLRKRIAYEVDLLAEDGAFVAEAVVVPSPLLRALYAGYHWMRKQRTYPSQSFEDLASATEWAERQAGGGGVDDGA